MTAMPPLRDISNGDAVDATDVEFNYNTIESYISTGVVKVDGTNAMTANLAMGSNRITGLAAPSADTDAARDGDVVRIDGTNAMTAALDLGSTVPTLANHAAKFSEAARSDYAINVASPTITTGGVLVATLTVYSPIAGLAQVHALGEFTAAGVTFDTGGGALSAVVASFSGATHLAVDAYGFTGEVGGNLNVALLGSNTTVVGAMSPAYVTLAAGTNTIGVTLTRANGGATTGGTFSIGSYFRVMILGA